MMQSADEFLSRFGDVIDDRVAEMLDEMPDDRDARLPRRRLRPVLAAPRLLPARRECRAAAQRARCLHGLALDGRDLPGGHPDHQIGEIMTVIDAIGRSADPPAALARRGRLAALGARAFLLP